MMHNVHQTSHDKWHTNAVIMNTPVDTGFNVRCGAVFIGKHLANTRHLILRWYHQRDHTRTISA